MLPAEDFLAEADFRLDEDANFSVYLLDLLSTFPLESMNVVVVTKVVIVVLPPPLVVVFAIIVYDDYFFLLFSLLLGNPRVSNPRSLPFDEVVAFIKLLFCCCYDC